jgi:glycosyltransferase involved in cell wall biosynthesis
MKIAHLLPYSARFPLSKHNGRYEWALGLAQRQAGDGHRVTVYSAPGSSDNSKIIWESSTSDLGSKDLNNQELIKTALSQDHDIYHSHFDYLHYRFANLTDKPIVFTQHWFPDTKIAEAAKHNTKRNVFAVPPTEYMYREDQKLGIHSLGAIHHGIDLDLFKPSPSKPDGDARLVFIGRITPRKGVLEAAEIAHEANVGLDIAGKVNNTDKEYWERIEPLVDGSQISYLGPKTQEEVRVLFQQAKAFLFPVREPEAFGLVIIEAQACGTPVIVNDVGAASELVEHGKTGFVVNSRQQYIDAIKDIDKIDRDYCRKFAEKFDFNLMAAKYYRLYEELMSK